MIVFIPPLVIDYTNHRGERSIRAIEPTKVIYWGSTIWHPEEQWLLPAWDLDKRSNREFAVKNIHAMAAGNSATGRAVESVYKQLQRSIEKNGRMFRRMQQLQGVVALTSDDKTLFDAIGAILKDEEPTWQEA